MTGERRFVDVIVRHPRAQKYLARASRVDGAAAAIAAQAKRARYPSLPEEGVVAAEPFCVETFGRLSPDALQLLRDARLRIAEREGGPLRGWASLALFQRWLAQLSCELQRALHEATLAMWGKCGRLRTAAPEEGPLVSAALPFVRGSL